MRIRNRSDGSAARTDSTDLATIHLQSIDAELVECQSYKRFCGVRDRPRSGSLHAIVELRSYFPFLDPNIRKDHGWLLDRIVLV